MPTWGLREGRQSHATICGGGLAGCSFNIVDGAVCAVVVVVIYLVHTHYVVISLCYSSSTSYSSLLPGIIRTRPPRQTAKKQPMYEYGSTRRVRLGLQQDRANEVLIPLNIYPYLSLLIEPKRGRPKRSGKFMTCTLAECHVKVCVLQMD